MTLIGKQEQAKSANDVPGIVPGLCAEHAQLCTYLTTNAPELAGTPGYRRVVLTHRLLTDLLDNPGDPNVRVQVAQRLAELEAQL